MAQGKPIAPNKPIALKVEGGTVSSVTVATGGKPAAGSMNDARTEWTPSKKLDDGTAYTITVTAKNADGVATTTKREVTTSLVNTVVSAPQGLKTTGNAQPIVVTFSRPVYNKDEVTQKLKVSDTKNVEGAWHWISPTRVDYRPKTFWPMGDTITVNGNLDGVKTGVDTFASGDSSTTFTVNSDLQAKIDLKKREMVVEEHGKKVKTIKIASGKPGHESLSGTMVVLSKSPKVRMTSCSVGLGCDASSPEYYDQEVPLAVQTTPSGTYLHGAPWDKQIGKVDSSHGCIHMSLEDAKWFFSHVQVGDLVTVTGNDNKVKLTNGEADWNLSWEEWAKG